jgi:hypothetical protein
MTVTRRWPVEIIDAVADNDADRNLLAQAIRKLMDAGYVVVPSTTNRGAVDLLRAAAPFVVWPPGTPMEERERWASAVAALTHGGQ